MNKNDELERDLFIEKGIELGLDGREAKMLWMCLEYSEDPFGSPNHILMMLVSKLWDLLLKLSE